MVGPGHRELRGLCGEEGAVGRGREARGCGQGQARVSEARTRWVGDLGRSLSLPWDASPQLQTGVVVQFVRQG